MIDKIKAMFAGPLAWCVLSAFLALAAFAGSQMLIVAKLETQLAKRDADIAKASAEAQKTARETERKLQASAEDAAAQYEKGKNDANTAADALLVDLLTRNVRMRPAWQCPASARVPATAATARELNAADADRAASASRIVRAAADCDAQVTALQALVRSYVEGTR